MYSQEDYFRRPPQHEPEIVRLELSQLALQIHAMGHGELTSLSWLDVPPQESWQAAEELLTRLGALDYGVLSSLGREMVRYPLHPRLSRLLLEAEKRGAGEEGCAAAAWLSAGTRWAENPGERGLSDILALLDQSMPLVVRKAAGRLRRVVRPATREMEGYAIDEALCIALLAAFPDRVARRRVPSGRGKQNADAELLLTGGGGALLSRSSVVQDAELLVAVDVEQRREQGQPLVRLASAIEPEWLLDLFPERLRQVEEVEWHREAERVETVRALFYDDLVIDRDTQGANSEAVSRLLAEKAWEKGLDGLTDMEDVREWIDRVRFASEHGAVRPVDDGDIQAALLSLCDGLRSFAELRVILRDGALLEILRTVLPPEENQLVEKLSPARIGLPGGRRVNVRYPAGRPPWIASRLQDFFGMTETPRVAGGAVPVVVHLLAPNQRPVQMTTDLAGFWNRHYPELRRQLSRRYPKHSWPETVG